MRFESASVTQVVWPFSFRTLSLRGRSAQCAIPPSAWHSGNARREQRHAAHRERAQSWNRAKAADVFMTTNARRIFVSVPLRTFRFVNGALRLK
jgi:hypothetical protein